MKYKVRCRGRCSIAAGCAQDICRVQAVLGFLLQIREASSAKIREASFYFQKTNPVSIRCHDFVARRLAADLRSSTQASAQPRKKALRLIAQVRKLISRNVSCNCSSPLIVRSSAAGCTDHDKKIHWAPVGKGDAMTSESGGRDLASECRRGLAGTRC